VRHWCSLALPGPWRDRRCSPLRPAAGSDRTRGRCGRGRRPVRPRRAC